MWLAICVRETGSSIMLFMLMPFVLSNVYVAVFCTCSRQNSEKALFTSKRCSHVKSCKMDTDKHTKARLVLPTEEQQRGTSHYHLPSTPLHPVSVSCSNHHKITVNLRPIRKSSILVNVKTIREIPNNLEVRIGTRSHILMEKVRPISLFVGGGDRNSKKRPL